MQSPPLPVGFPGGIAQPQGVEIETGKMPGIGITAQANIDGIGPLFQGGFQRGQAPCGTK